LIESRVLSLPTAPIEICLTETRTTMRSNLLFAVGKLADRDQPQVGHLV
jgi:hypothetical protein